MMHLKTTTLPAVFPRSACVNLMQVCQKHFQHWRSAVLMMILALGLTGCLDAQTRIQFDTPYRGQLVQAIELGSQLAVAQDWLNQLEARAQQLDAKVQRPSSQALLLTLPFTNAADLETKFNQLVNPPQPRSTSDSDQMPSLSAHLQVNTSNLLLLQRNRLIYDIDLTSLGLRSANGDVLFNTGDVMALSFGLNGPWGAGGPAVDQQDGQAMWRIKPGQPNHIEATLWMPNPIGLGAVAIVGLVVAGTYYLRQSA